MAANHDPGQPRGAGKAAVLSIFQRSRTDKPSRIRAGVIPNTQKITLHAGIRATANEGATLYTDAWRAYRGLAGFTHVVVDHAVEYVNGRIHTNGVENFGSLLKRSIKGTYVSVEPFHLGRYIDEQVFRFNERKGGDADRFWTALQGIIGRKLTYRELIGNGAIASAA